MASIAPVLALKLVIKALVSAMIIYLKAAIMALTAILLALKPVIEASVSELILALMVILLALKPGIVALVSAMILDLRAGIQALTVSMLDSLVMVSIALGYTYIHTVRGLTPLRMGLKLMEQALQGIGLDL